MTAAAYPETTRRDYDAWAELYDDFIRGPAGTEPFGHALIGVFADLVRLERADALVLDAGCGPGHHTDRLDRAGLRARGIDLSPAMIDIARRYRPDLPFEVGSHLALELADGCAGGVLAHYSLIHTPPAQVATALAEFARVLAPGGYLLLGFQSGDSDLETWEPFDHKVSPGYRWSLDAMSARLRSAGFVEAVRLLVQPGPTGRFPDGYLLARKA